MPIEAVRVVATSSLARSEQLIIWKKVGERSTSELGVVHFAIDIARVQRMHVDTTQAPAGAAVEIFEFCRVVAELRRDA
jgi:hypothetical protein